MKNIKPIFLRTGAVLCAVFCSFAFASCGKAEAASSPFKYTFIGEAETYSDSVHTYGCKKETVSEEVTASYYYACVYAVNIGRTAAALNASCFSIAVGDAVYAGEGFISFNKESQREYAEDGSYTETVISTLSESSPEKNIEPSFGPVALKISFALSSLPNEYSLNYNGIPLENTNGTAEAIISRGVNADKNLYIGAVEASSEGDVLKAADTGKAVYSYCYINETAVTATYNALNIKATVGTEDVTVEAEKFILKSGDKSYKCKGFASSDTSGEQLGEILITSTNVTISLTYTVKSDEIGDMSLVFECDFSSLKDYSLYYGEAELTE